MVTCYSPVRHSTCTRGCFLVRLACVRHAASVHPEPGSNSPFEWALSGLSNCLIGWKYLKIHPDAPLQSGRVLMLRNRFLGMTGVSLLRLPCVRPNNTLACIKLPFHVCFAWTVSGSQGPRGPAGPLRSHGLTRSARGSILRLPTCPVNGFLGEFREFLLRTSRGAFYPVLLAPRQVLHAKEGPISNEIGPSNQVLALESRTRRLQPPQPRAVQPQRELQRGGHEPLPRT